MEDKIINMSAATDKEFEIIKHSWDKFNENVDRVRYFGYVDKTTLKDLNKTFDYVDTRSWIGGVIIGVGLAAACGYYKLCKKKAKENNEGKES